MGKHLNPLEKEFLIRQYKSNRNCYIWHMRPRKEVILMHIITYPNMHVLDIWYGGRRKKAKMNDTCFNRSRYHRIRRKNHAFFFLFLCVTALLKAFTIAGDNFGQSSSNVTGYHF